MNEQVARDVVLVRAIESMDQKHEVLSDDDRMYASRSARELAQWQASDSKAELTQDHFLQQRAEQILKRLSERTPAMAAFLHRPSGLGVLPWALAWLALALGAGLDRIADPHRVDLLSAPLLGIIGWNLLVYLGLVLAMLIPATRGGWASQGLLQRFSGGKAALPRKMPSVLTAALAHFVAEWSELSARLTRARLARTVHLCAAMFGLGAMLSLYARGLFSQYSVGWESTFLDAGQVHAILSMLFAPATFAFNIQPFSVADISSLHFSQTATAVGGARWVHLYAATLLLIVVLPRMVLAGVAHWRARQLVRNFPLDLTQPYFRKLANQLGVSGPAVLRVLPYSFTLDEARDKGLSAVAAMLLGEQARVMLRPSYAYGEEPREALADANLDDASATVTAVLFNLAATPEKENHGAFLDYLVRKSPRGIAVLLDESGLLERLGEHGEVRVTERIALWQQFCNFHRAPATVVNLLAPQTRALDTGAGLTLSKAP
ncbi:DUF2868 domain-containing protein [Massilia glaciei]|uniref:DUF2868 domain-containing protein n=1 Tax=Massilia glaciei TaxID=1524097 RepID=A0A2U2HN70_9BURK|nr:DUF2868 domain-containing protein [Massilia glaciei]PWF48876.1 DUF2868 domain-containing protein [Massilia glaciei]